MRPSYLTLLFSLLTFPLYAQEGPVELTYFTTESLLKKGPLNPFLSAAGPLNRHSGVFSPWGPMMALGPYGYSPWNVSTWMKALGNWEDLQAPLTQNGGPLSKKGPAYILSSEGQKQFHSFNTNPYLKSLRAGGELHILGEAGPLGPQGIMGPFSVNGAHGHEVDGQGRFKNKQGRVVNKIKVETVDGEKSFDLYEVYRNIEANKIDSPDGNFAYFGQLKNSTQVDTLHFTSPKDQWVSLVVGGEYTLDNFQIQVRTRGSDDVLFKSAASDTINFIVFKAPRGAQFDVDIQLINSKQFLSKPYRLFVTSTSEEIVSVSGPHQQKLMTQKLRFKSAMSLNCYKNLAKVFKP